MQSAVHVACIFSTGHRSKLSFSCTPAGITEEFELRIKAVQNPVDGNGTPIVYLDLVACGPDADRSVSAMPMNILARVVTLDYWEDGIGDALDALIQEGTETIIESPKWPVE